MDQHEMVIEDLRADIERLKALLRKAYWDECGCLGGLLAEFMNSGPPDYAEVEL